LTTSSPRRSTPSSKNASLASEVFPKHPVDAYAQAVVDGTISAGPLVRLACQRHLRDRAAEGIPSAEKLTAHGLHFDAAKATHAIEFFSKFLRFADGLKAGQPFILDPWQQFIVGSLFGWISADGTRRFRTAYLEVGKGNGKTPLLAGIGLYLLVADHEPSAEIYCAAFSSDQARVLFRDAERFVENSPSLRKKIRASVGNLAVPETFSFFRPVSSEHRTLDGKRVHGGLIDELHEHPTSLVMDKIRAGTKGRTQALVIAITNAGFDRTSVCWHHHELSRQVLEGSVENESWFAYVCGVDDADDPLSDESCWIKANPNLGVSIPRKYLKEQVDEANAMPTKANLVLRLNFCQWTTAETRAIDMQQWFACPPVPSESALIGAVRFAGLDIGQSDDITAFVIVWVLADSRVAIKPRFWLPSGALEQYPTRPYDSWRRAGALEITPGLVTDLDLVERAVLDDCRRYGVKELAYDKRFAQQLAQHLTGQGVMMIDTAQGFPLNEALVKLFALIAEGKLCHPRNPVLDWMAGNCVTVNGRLGEVRLAKERAADKIDGISALAMALDRVVRMPVRSAQPEIFIF
jgi:phage terminase large subunit-like protein